LLATSNGAGETSNACPDNADLEILESTVVDHFSFSCRAYANQLSVVQFVGRHSADQGQNKVRHLLGALTFPDQLILNRLVEIQKITQLKHTKASKKADI
jgi:hypothetical protein